MLTLNHGIMKAEALLFNCQDGGIRVLDVGGGGEGVLLQEGARALFGVVQVRIKLNKLNIQLDNDNSALVCLLRRHTRGEELPGLLTVVPDCLTSRVCLYRFVHGRKGRGWHQFFHLFLSPFTAYRQSASLIF